MKYGICPLCQHDLRLELPDSDKMVKLVLKAEKKAKKELARQKNAGKGHPEDKSVAGRLTKQGNQRIQIDVNAVLTPPGEPHCVEWLLQLSSIPAELQTVFYAAANRLPGFRKTPVNLRPNTVDAFVLRNEWYLYFGRHEKQRLRVQRRTFSQGDTRICLLLGENDRLVSGILHPVCPYCNHILPDEFATMTDPPVNICLIGNPRVGKTVWQTALYHYLFRSCSAQPDFYFTVPQWVNSTSHANFTDMSEEFRRGLIPTWTLQEVVVPVLTQRGTEQTPAPVRTNSGAGARAVPLVLILHMREGGTWRMRYVCIRDYPGENLRRFLNGVQNIDFLRKADAFFIFEDIFGEEENAPRDYENAAQLFTGKVPTDEPPYIALVVPKVDKPAFLSTLQTGLETRFCDIFAKTLLHYCEQEGYEPRETDARRLACLFSRQFLRQSPENLAGCIYTNYKGLLCNSVFSGKTIASDGAAVLTAEEIFGSVVADDVFLAHFPPMAARDWVAHIAKTCLFSADGVDDVSNTHAVSFDSDRNLLRQYYMRVVFSALGKYNLLLTENYDKFRDISIFPVSALGMEAPNRQFDYNNWRPLNLPEPLFWLLYKLRG